MRNKVRLFVGLMAVTLLTGCGNPLKKMEASTIYVKEDNSITSISIEDFDKDYYVESELDSLIKTEVEEHNKQFGDKHVKVDKLKVEDKKATLTMEYASVEDYNEFNDSDFIIGQIAGSNLAGEFVDETGKAVALDDIKKDDKLKVIKTSEPTQVMVKGKVVYYTNGLELMDKNLVKTKDGVINYIIYQ